MSKELTKTENTELTTTNEMDDFNIEAEQNITKNDIAIPKILIMQGQSPRVLEGEASFGELRDTLNWEILGQAKHGQKPAVPLEVLPIHWEKYWINKKADGDKWKTESMEKMTTKNENLGQYESWKGEDGINRKRIYLHLFYVLLKGKTIPYTIGLRGSSKQAGDALATQMYVVNKTINTKKAWLKSPMGKWITLTPHKVSKNDNTYISLTTTAGKESTLEEAKEARDWYKAVRSGEMEVDNSDIIDEGHNTTEMEY